MTERESWELISPSSEVNSATLNPNPHLTSLEGKTVLLRWNAKHNGDIFLSRIGEFLTAKIKGVKIIKGWEVVPETKTHSMNPDTSRKFASKLAGFKPDIVIGAQGD